MEGGAGALEVGEFHPRIFAGEDDAVGIALEGGEDGIANAIGGALAVGGRTNFPYRLTKHFLHPHSSWRRA